MSEAGLLVLVLVFFVIPALGLYLAIDRETSNPTVVKRSEAEQIAQDRGGRPAAGETDREGADRSADNSGEWGESREEPDRQ